MGLYRHGDFTPNHVAVVMAPSHRAALTRLEALDEGESFSAENLRVALTFRFDTGVEHGPTPLA